MNRKLTKLMVMFLAAALMVSCFVITSYADEKPAATVSNATGSVGDNVTVSIDISGNPGVSAWHLDVAFDGSALELVSSDLNGVFGELNAEELSNPYKMTYADLKLRDSVINGKACELTFKIKDTASEGKYVINITDSEYNTFTNSEEKNIDFKLNNGTITVVSKPESKVESKAASKPESKVESKAASKPESKVESKAASKPESKVESKAASKPESKVESKTESTIGTVSVVSAAVSGVSSDKSASGSDATVSGSSSKNSSTTSNTSGTSSTNSSTSSTSSSKSSSTSNNNNPSSPKTGTATPLAGTVVLLLASAAAMVSLGKRKED